MSKGHSEFELIDWIKHNQHTHSPDIQTGIGDDMAVLNYPHGQLLITTDILLQGIHFDPASATLEQIGYKAMACSLSDCAAMASIPVAAVVAVALNNQSTLKDGQTLYSGMEKAAQNFQCPIVGGDTTTWPHPLAVNVTMFSRPGNSAPVLRSTAKPGDHILVTGLLGGSAKGRHLNFIPRIHEAQKLTSLCPIHAMIDLSDGLAGDLRHLCTQSSVNAQLETHLIPISQAAEQTKDPLHAALTDGEDFELLFCISPNDTENLLRQWPSESDLPLNRIGQITEPKKNQHTIYLQNLDGSKKPLTQTGWQHHLK